MKIELYTDNLEEYLKCDDVVNFDNEAIAELSDVLFHETIGEMDFIRKAYEYVRDNIPHSVDINEDLVTCSASEVLKAGHDICFAKSHLLTAILRYKAVPAGFCYQKLILDDEAAPVLAYHGLNEGQISLRELLQYFFMTIDPTTVNRQRNRRPALLYQFCSAKVYSFRKNWSLRVTGNTESSPNRKKWGIEKEHVKVRCL